MEEVAKKALSFLGYLLTAAFLLFVSVICLLSVRLIWMDLTGEYDERMRKGKDERLIMDWEEERRVREMREEWEETTQ